MSNPNDKDKQQSTQTETPTSIGRCLIGSAISSGFALGCYWLMSSIAQAFASKPITSTNPTAINISVAVRTLVVGMAALGTGLFSIVAVGLIALMIQTIIQQLKQPKTD